MKPKTFFKSALLVPYILWVICFLTVYLPYLRSDQTDPFSNLNSILSFLLMVIFYYTFGAIVWFIPYTILAIGLLIWSRHKPINDIYKAALGSPLLLLVLMFLVSVLLSIDTGGIREILKNATTPFLVLGIFSLAFGYLCVGIALGVYKLLKSHGFIIEDEKITHPDPSLLNG